MHKFFQCKPHKTNVGAQSFPRNQHSPPPGLSSILEIFTHILITKLYWNNDKTGKRPKRINPNRSQGLCSLKWEILEPFDNSIPIFIKKLFPIWTLRECHSKKTYFAINLFSVKDCIYACQK